MNCLYSAWRTDPYTYHEQKGDQLGTSDGVFDSDFVSALEAYGRKWRFTRIFGWIDQLFFAIVL